MSWEIKKREKREVPGIFMFIGTLILGIPAFIANDMVLECILFAIVVGFLSDYEIKGII